MPTGALEKIVEHWLTNTKERGFQVAYGQLLINQGHRVLHLSAHTESELGKDIIAVAPDGVPCGYQLKIDDISLSQWRTEVWPECEQLLSLPLVHPSLPRPRRHRSYLVTTGDLSESVRNDLHQRNQERRRHRQPLLEVVVRGQLLQEFAAAQSAVLPWDPEDYQRFFNLYRHSGRAPIPKEDLSALLLSLLPFGAVPARQRDVREQLSRTVLIANYALEPYRQVPNWWALTEGWTMVAAHLTSAAERTKLPERQWGAMVGLAHSAALSAVEELWKQLQGETVLVGFAISDSLTYRWRITQLCGWLAGLCLAKRLSGAPHPEEQGIADWCETHQEELTLPGEDLVPHWLAVAWLFSLTSRDVAADRLIARAMEQVLEANRRDGPGLPNPYYATEAVLRQELAGQYPIPNPDRIEEQFHGYSFCLESLVLLAARRGLRSLLKQSWPAISHVLWATFHPRPLWNWYLWRAQSGERGDVHPPETQSYAALQARARSPQARHLPASLRAHPASLVLFLLCYPHRLTPDAVTFIDSQL